MTSLAFELREERSRRGLSQQRMAAALGVSVRQYQRWEGGGSAPRRHERERVLAALAEVAAEEADLAAELTAVHAEVEQLRLELAQVRLRLRVLRAGQAA